MANGESPPVPAATGQRITTLTIRITEELRAKLDVVAQLTGRSATEEIRLAVEQRIEQIKSDPEVLKKAEAVRAEIEREAQTQRNAIAAIFAGDGGTGGKTPSTRATNTGAKRSS